MSDIFSYGELFNDPDLREAERAQEAIAKVNQAIPLADPQVQFSEGQTPSQLFDDLLAQLPDLE